MYTRMRVCVQALLTAGVAMLAAAVDLAGVATWSLWGTGAMLRIAAALSVPSRRAQAGMLCYTLQLGLALLAGGASIAAGLAAHARQCLAIKRKVCPFVRLPRRALQSRPLRAPPWRPQRCLRWWPPRALRWCGQLVLAQLVCAAASWLGGGPHASSERE